MTKLHMTDWDRDAALTTARILLEIKAVNFRPEEPYTFTSGWKSPVYIDCRRIIYFPRARAKICELAVEKIGRHVGYETIEAVAGGETAGIPFAAWIADRMLAPMAYVRKQAEGLRPQRADRGRRAGGQAHAAGRGPDHRRRRARSASPQALREAGAIVNHAFVVFFYGVFPGSFETLARDGHRPAPSLHLVGRAGGLPRPPVFLRRGARRGAALPGEPGGVVGRAWRRRQRRGGRGAQERRGLTPRYLRRSRLALAFARRCQGDSMASRFT